MMKLLAIIAVALLLGTFGSGFFLKGILFNLGVLAGVEMALWAKRRQTRIKAVGQIVIRTDGSKLELTGGFLRYRDHWEFYSDSNERYFSYDQGATWAKAMERWGDEA